MKNFKKLFSIAAIVAIVGTFAPVATLGAATYSEELEGAYDYAYNNGITTMSSIDNADMYGSLTRIAMAKMMANYAVEVLGKNPDATKECSFPDVSEELDAQYDNGVTKACQLGLMGVGIDNFNPNGLVTRAEFGTVLSRALYGDANNGGTPYYADHLAALKDAGIMNNIDTPTQLEVRGYVMLMMQRASGNATPAICELPENVLACSLELDTCPAECQNVTPVVPGFITVSSVGSVTTQYVPKNAVNKKIGSIKLTAGENDTTVTSVTIKHAGLANTNSDLLVKLLTTAGATATNEKYFTNNEATLRFSPSLVLKAGSSMTFDVVASIDGEQNEHHEFSVSSAIVVNGTASGLPVVLGNLNTTSYTVNTGTELEIASASSIAAGKVQEKIVTVDISNPDIDINVAGLTLTSTGDIDLPDALDNVKAYYEGVVVGNVTMTDDEIVVAGLDIDAIDGETISLDIKADTTYIGATDYTTFQIKKNDLLATEIVTNEQVRSVATDNTSELTFNGADFTLTNMMGGAKTYAPGTNSIELFNTKITSANEFDVTTYSLSLTTTATNERENFTNDKVTVYVNGVDYDRDTSTDKDFTLEEDYFNVAPGAAATIRVVGSAKSTIALADLDKTYKITLDITGLKNVNEDDSFAVTESKAGDTITINQGEFTLSKQSSIPTNKTVLEGSVQNVAFFNLKATSENQILTGLTATLAGDFASFSGFASRVDLMQGTTVVKSITDELDLGDSVVFEDLSFTLTKDVVIPFTIRVTLDDGEVTNLGNAFAVNVDSDGVLVRRSAKNVGTSASSHVLVDGKTYQLASVIPTVTIPTQDGKNTTVQIQNGSQYDVVVHSMKIEMAKNRDGGSYIEWLGTADLLDAVGGTVITGGFDVPGTVTFNFTGDVSSSDTLNRIVELVAPEFAVTDADYVLTVKELIFDYVDGSDESATSITESYNVSK